ncbi:MAG: 2-C-methyl-D-erythritol 2,4-cyclodiphosphate synthase [Firmicutes bacterium]|nr:2-C-methyl-D-erythritol 2,4-cyclodiphosphate synthase [Bacillota bacterium]
MNNINTVAILLAAGKGTRAGLGHNKALHTIDNISVLEQSFNTLKQCVKEIVIVANYNELDTVKQLLKNYMPTIVSGGNTRFESVRCGLNAIVSNRIFCDIVIIHDSARCMIDCDTIQLSIKSAIKYGSGIACIPANDTVKLVKDKTITTHLARKETYLAQTPQSFGFKQIYNAYFLTKDTEYTDDSQVYADIGFIPYYSQGALSNKKLTHPCDFEYTTHFNLPYNFKIGHGYDVHQLTENRKLILGGITIPHNLGLLGHSDADVLTHSIMDALLSASNLPDIGINFPDTEPRYKDANSIDLLKKVHALIKNKGKNIVNISCVIMAQSPKLAYHIPLIEENLANALKINKDNIKISATTTENLGIVGNNQGIAASTVCLLNG